MVEAPMGHVVPEELTEDELWQTVKEVFSDQQNRDIWLTAGQFEIFESVFRRKHPRLHIMCQTRYGKSMAVGLAVLLRASTHAESWIIAAGTKDDAKVIMGVINDHLYDYPPIEQAYTGSTSKKSRKRPKRQNHVTFDVGDGKVGSIKITTGANALGEGAPNVVMDEAALVDDYDYSLIDRMIDDNPHDNFLCKIGNPFKRNHFLKSYASPSFHNIVIDYKQALAEGRMTEERIEENRDLQNFDILYGCEFPDAQDLDEDGYQYLISEDTLQNAFNRQVQPQGTPRLAVDVARGGRNKNVWTLRYNNYGLILGSSSSHDLMDIAGKTIEFAKEYNVPKDEIRVDDTGVGGGVTDRLRELDWEPVAVKLGGRPDDEWKDDYHDRKAQLYASPDGLANWLEGGGSLEEHDGLTDLLEIRYKNTSRGKLRIERKKSMRKRGVQSPDFADSLMLTFADTDKSDYKVPKGTPMRESMEPLEADPYMS